MEPETRKGNPLLRVLEAIADIAIVGILWALCSLPVITLGAATVFFFAGGCSFMNSCFIFEQKSIYEKYFSY